VIDTEGLTHLHLRVSDLSASLRFYQGVFGMREMFRDGELVFLNTPGSNDLITLNPLGDGPVGADGGVGHFGFRLKPHVDLDDAISAVEDSGGKLINRGEHTPGVRFAYVADPDGYVIEL
jgi:metallothiol transferase